jgi:hypothetical protein
MFRLIFTAIFSLVIFTVNVSAQMSDTETGEFKVNVISPLTVTLLNDGGESDLGYLPRGSQKTLNSSYSLVFRVDGFQGMDISSTGTGDQTSSDGEVTLSGVTWEYQNVGQGGNYTAISAFPHTGTLNEDTGSAWIRVYPQNIQATIDATNQEYSFDFTLTCAYINL